MEKHTAIKPTLFEKLWGGDRLAAYGKNVAEGANIGESWELSFMPGAVSEEGGVPLDRKYGKEDFGTAAAAFSQFPVLTKFIDAADTLSVQVHPTDDYARAHGYPSGKTEMWVVVDAAPGAGLYLGMKGTYTRAQVETAIGDGTLSDLLSFVPVKPGDVYFIPAGTVHAIGRGVLLYEIQQSADLTYRMWDFNRRDKDGNLRPLHIESALDVAKLEPYKAPTFPTTDSSVVGMSDAFVTRICKLNASEKTFSVDKTSYLMLTALCGKGTVNGEKIQKGDTFFFPANTGDVRLCGTLTAVAVTTGK